VLIRSVTQVAAGDRVTTRLSDGSFDSRVEETAQPKARNRNKIPKK
jgi:exonuclease VII large subunit